MHRQLIDRHPDGNIDALFRVIGICIRVFLAGPGSKFATGLLNQEIELAALLPKLDLSDPLLDRDFDPQFFRSPPQCTVSWPYS